MPYQEKSLQYQVGANNRLYHGFTSCLLLSQDLQAPGRFRTLKRQRWNEETVIFILLSVSGAIAWEYARRKGEK